MSKLTQSFLSKLKPDTTDRLLWDDAIPGFGVRIKSSGSVSFLIQYRNSGGRSRRYTLGRYGKLTLVEARKLAQRLFAQVAEGADPAEDRASKRNAPTIADLAGRFLTEYAEVHKKQSSVKEDRRIIENTIKPRLGGHKTADITRADIAKLHNAMRATPYEANRTVALLSKMFNQAELWGLRPDGSNPCRHVKRFRERQRERFFSAEELQAIGAVLERAAESGLVSVSCVVVVRLLALTGCRLGEILALNWDDVDLESRTIRLRDAKTGDRAVVLSALAAVLLQSLPRIGPFVVHGRDPDKRLSVNIIEKAWCKIRTQAGVENARLHDFRHTFGTYGGQGGHNAFLIRDLLGHRTLAMTGRYVERDNDPLRAASDQVASRIAAAMEGQQAAEIIPLTKKKSQKLS